ncbi:uncharacterized protein [Ptychodera flava]|uniref:uncharacterized protein isoform X3 n=1 Tax=Ptychodera flava TaxID=63121 RepID=UPI003969C7D4
MASAANTNGDCLVEVGEADDGLAPRSPNLCPNHRWNNGQFYLSPHTTAMRLWECCIVITVAITFSLEMFLAAFDSQLLVLWVIAYLFDFIYLLDIVRHFFLGYMENGILITDRRKIRKHYLLTTFIVDLFTVLPLDLLVFISPGVVPGHMKRLAQYRCINRLLRVHRILSFFNSRESELGTNTSLVRTLKYTTLAALMNHLLSCAWYALTCVGLHDGLDPVCYNNSWGTSPEIDLGTELANTSTGDAYIITLYWAVATTTSTGYGDIHSINENERWFSTFGMLLGIFVFFGMILGGMASMLTNFDGQRARYTHRLNVVKNHLKDLTVPEELQKLVIGYYEYLWVRKKGVHSEGMFDTLPLTFQAEVSLIANKYILDKAPMFKSMNEGFLRMLSLVIKPSLYLPNQTIANRGEIGHSMYFIHRGEVEVLSEDDDECAIANLKSGKLFGEVSLIFSMPRTHAIRAGAHCDLMVLDKVDLQKVLIHYPDVAKTLQEIAENRCDTAGHLHERVQAGEGVIPASKSLRRPSVAAAMPPRAVPRPSNTDKRKSSLMASPKRETRATTRVAITKSIDVFELEEPGGQWVAVHKGNCCTRLRKRLSDLADKIQNGVIEPNSHFYKVWEKLVLIVTLLVSFIYSYMASFTANQHTSGYGDSPGATALLVISYCLDLVLIADIFVKLRTAVATPNGNLKDFASIRKHYCRSFGFVLDIIAILPLELLCFFQPAGHLRWHLFSFLRLNRVIKYWIVPNFFSKLEDNLDVDIGTIRFFKFFIYISQLSHWHACIWYLAACHADMCYNGLNGENGQAFVFTSKGSRNSGDDSIPQLCDDSNNCTAGSWADHADIRPDTDPFKEYVLAMYWAAATMSSTGYGDISAHTTVGRAIALAAMLVGLLLYGYCLSSIAATLANADAPRVKFQEKLFAVQEFMRDHGLGSDLQQRVVNYLSLLFRRHRGETMPGGQRLMHDMPITLQQDIAFEDAQATLGNVPLFKDCDPSFIRMLSLKTHAYLFTPGDIIVYQGDMGREMYFIRRGTCEVLSSDMSRVNSVIGPGQYFGEVGLIFGDYRTATVRASSYCELMMLQRSDLDEVLNDFPIIAKQFKEAAENKQHLMELRNASKKNTEEETKPHHRDSERSCQELLLTPHNKPTEESVKVFDSSSDDYKGPFKSLSPITYALSFLLMKRCFLPSGKWFQKWEIVRVGVAIVVVFTVSLQAAFLHMDVALWVINYALDMICYIDMYLKFHTAFYNENNVLVTHPLSTAKHYLKTNFLFDLMACFPTELIAFCIFGSFTGYAIHVYTVVRLNRLLGVYRLPLAFNYLESGVEHETEFIREVKFLFYLLMFIHLLACLWFINACPPIFAADPTEDDFSGRIQTNYHMCLNTSWAFKYADHNTTAESIAGQYIVSLYWASATCASVGYGDIHAFNVGEMVIALLSMIVGIVFFGYIIASVAASLANADAQRARYQEKLTAIKSFMKDQDMDYELRQRVVSFYEYLWMRTKGVDPDSLFDGLPLSLKADVTLSLYQEIINQVPLFQNTEIGFQKMLSMCIKPTMYLAKEYIVRKHDIGSEMFFIHRGVVEVVSEDGAIVFDTMQAGRFFGEISLVFSVPRTASIRAQNNCDLFVLTKDDLDRVLTHYPLIKEQIQKTAEERISAVRKRSKQKANIAPAKPSSSATKQDKIDEKDETKTDDAKKDEPKKDEKKEGEKKDQNGQPSLPGAPGPSNDDNQIEQLAIDIGSDETPRQRGCCTKFCSKERFRSCLAAIKKSNRFVLDPSSRFVRYLKYLTCLLGLVTSWTIIYEAAFQHHHIGILVFSYICEGIFWFEIYIKFHVSYSDKYAELEKDFVKVYNHYFRQTNGFLVDIIAALPIDVFALCANSQETRLMALSLLRLIHLLRLIRVSNFFTAWEKELNINVLFVRLCKFFVELFMLIHLFASIWYVIACPLGNCMADTWADHANTANMGTLKQYCDCIYWCVATMTSTGYGDIHAYTIGEMVFASFVMIVGQLIFGFILGNIASTLANAESNRVAYEEHLTAIKDHMKDQSLPSKLQKKVVSYYDYIWMRSKGVDVKELFKDAPSCLHAEIWQSTCEHLLKKLPLFRGAEDSFFRTLSPIVRRLLFMPNDYIVRQGDVGDEMYFIHRGTVARMSDKDETKACKILDVGDYFDDISLVYDVPRSCSHQAVTHVDVYALSRDDLQSVLKHYPIVEAQIKDIAAEMYGEASSSFAENNGVYLG